MDDIGALGEGKRVYLVNVWVEEAGRKELMRGVEINGDMVETVNGWGDIAA